MLCATYAENSTQAPTSSHFVLLSLAAMKNTSPSETHALGEHERRAIAISIAEPANPAAGRHLAALRHRFHRRQLADAETKHVLGIDRPARLARCHWTAKTSRETTAIAKTVDPQTGPRSSTSTSCTRGSANCRVAGMNTSGTTEASSNTGSQRGRHA